MIVYANKQRNQHQFHLEEQQVHHQQCHERRGFGLHLPAEQTCNKPITTQQMLQ